VGEDGQEAPVEHDDRHEEQHGDEERDGEHVRSLWITAWSVKVKPVE
jgi:hypothetical protein